MTNFQIRAIYYINEIGAASGLYLNGNDLYIISDNSTFLNKYDIVTANLNKISLFDNAQDNIPKSIKNDFEAITFFDNKIFIFGSGSTEKRNLKLSYNIDNQEITKFDITKTYDKLAEFNAISRNNLNIEGVFFKDDILCFFQRGNGAEAQNGVFNWNEKTEEIGFSPINLGQTNGVKVNFTDAILVDNNIYFLAAAENTDSTYKDGEVMGSFIGKMDFETLTITFLHKISDAQKFEGLTLFSQSETNISFLICEDADSSVLETIVYKLDLELD